MKRVNRIWEHPLYREAYVRIQELEQDREFCGHSAEHFLAVARLMRIYDLQEDTGLSKESIYAAALLHDIGRHLQYLEGTPHQEASAALAAEILPACGFQKLETKEILEAIRAHRSPEIRQEKSLRGYLYRTAWPVRRSRPATGQKKKRIWRSQIRRENRHHENRNTGI